MSIVLLVGAGLLVRSLWQLQQVESRLQRRAACWRWKSRCRRRATRKASRCRSTSGSKSASARWPGVAEVGAINILPLSNNYDSRGVQVEDHPKPEGQGYAPQARSVTPGYFRGDGHPDAHAAASSTRTTSTTGSSS